MLLGRLGEKKITASVLKALLFSILLAVLHGPDTAISFDLPPGEGMENEFNGHLRAEGAAVRYDDDSVYQLVGTETGYDGQFDLRLNDKLFFSDQIYGEIHYEMFLTGGDNYKKNRQIQQIASAAGGIIGEDIIPSDRRRLFNLTDTLKKTDDYYLVHRLDRLLVSLQPAWGDLIIGRQAITWGNGLIFNPMDLFNPFAPTDTIRDYKEGDDLLSARIFGNRISELNLLAVPRRDLEDGELDLNQSSFAAKAHLFVGSKELDIMAARHYEEGVAGIGLSGYIGEAAFRGDAVYSTLSNVANKTGFLNLVMNLDYSWVWGSKNFYGLIEYFHNGLGKSDYQHALSNDEIVQRLSRGELYTLGRDYLAGQLQFELHPLFNLYLTIINNLSDPSGILQPRAVWSLSEDVTVNMGATTYYGAHDTEYGGFYLISEDNAGPGLLMKSPETLYLFLTWYF